MTSVRELMENYSFLSKKECRFIHDLIEELGKGNIYGLEFSIKGKNGKNDILTVSEIWLFYTEDPNSKECISIKFYFFENFWVINCYGSGELLYPYHSNLNSLNLNSLNLGTVVKTVVKEIKEFYKTHKDKDREWVFGGNE